MFSSLDIHKHFLKSIYLKGLFFLVFCLNVGQTSAQQYNSGSLSPENATIKRAENNPKLELLSSKLMVQGNSVSFSPVYSENQPCFISPLNSVGQGPWFEGAQWDDQIGNLPFKEFRILVGENERLEILNIEVQNSRLESSSLFSHVSSILGTNYTPSEFPSQSVVLKGLITVKKQHWQIIRIYPIQVNAQGNTLKISQKISFTYKIVSNPTKAIPSASFKTSAVSSLSTGDWYKVSLVEEGLYQLSGQALINAGISIEAINPNNLKIFTGHPSMLPQSNEAIRIDDVVEVPIQVVGDNDGQFNAEDYMVFYAPGPHEIKFDSSLNRLTHQYNVYSDSAYVFLNFEGSPGKRVLNQASLSPNYDPGAFIRQIYFHQDKVNLISSGRQWFGESFDVNPSQILSFPIENPHPDSLIKLSIQVAARAAQATAFSVYIQGVFIGSIAMNGVVLESNTGNYADLRSQTFLVSPSLAVNGSLPVQLVYSRPSATQGSNGWIDFAEVQYAQLKIRSRDQTIFHLPYQAGPGKIFDLSLGNMSSQQLVWEVSDLQNIKNIPFTLSGSTAILGINMAQTGKIAVFTTAQNVLLRPQSIKKINNQNIHGLPQANYLLVTSEELLSQAQQLADFHRSVMNYSVNLVTTAQIYNEFSGGKQDVSAIRDFVRMFYKRAGTDTTQMPKFLCLLGDGSFDYKRRFSSSEITPVPPYESRNSLSQTSSFVSDDFFGFLDDTEGLWGEGTNADPNDPFQTHGLDLGIGRLPAKTPGEAQVLINKIKQYAIGTPLGTWKNSLVLVADYKADEGSIHVSQSDSYSPLIQSQYPALNIDKVFLDYYKGINSAEGFIRFPEAKDALLRALDKGSLVVNYTGHGGETGWSNSRILEVPDIQAINNEGRLPLYLTATCEFGRWDEVDLTSGAELLLLKENAGSIAMLTTVRLVYSGPNQLLNQNFYKYVFGKNTSTGNPYSFGDIYRLTKNDSWGGGINTRSFSLLGDPGIALAFPKNQSDVTKINGVQIDTIADTLKALALVTIEGEVRAAGSTEVYQSFNGTVQATVFDKAARYTTILSPFNFRWQRNRIFNGTATIQNGLFRFQFRVPLDISYELGFGKISLYVENGQTDGIGSYDKFIVGGTDTTGVADVTGPVIDVFMNDEKWADGGLVNQNPLLLAKIYDDSGINTLGTGIGHEITAILNNDENKKLVLNDYYAAQKDSYQEGKISYSYQNLEEGHYDLKLKVWDVANNSSAASTQFVVANNARLALDHVLNYPNPFSTNTRFFFEHNQTGEMLQSFIRIYTISGKLVKTLQNTFYAEASLNQDLEWDGLDDFGDPIGKGVYVYEVTVKVLGKGETASKYEKLVLLR